jgi:hypothetical protein
VLYSCFVFEDDKPVADLESRQTREDQYVSIPFMHIIYISVGPNWTYTQKTWIALVIK